MAAVITVKGKIALSDAELNYLQALLNAGDRPSFYMAYYNMTGSAEAALQAQISSFSEAAGGTAYAAPRRTTRSRSAAACSTPISCSRRPATT